MLTLPLLDGAYLRLWEESDADELQTVVEAHRDSLSEFLPWPAAQTRETGLDFIKSSRRQIADNNGMQTAVILDGRIAGGIGVHGIDWPNRRTSIGYWLAPPAQGRGIMTAAVRAYTDHAFHGWGLERMELRAAPGNVRSRAVARRLGFTEEGTLRHAEHFGEGKVLDHVVYGMLATDWPATR
jgi:ribosomal-protein-serine acetyltransferase